MQPDLQANNAGAVVVHRPVTMTAGAVRHIKVYLDDHLVADLARGDSIRVPAGPGPHLLQARCTPLIPSSVPVILEPGEVLHARVCVTPLDELDIDFVED